MPSRKLAIMKTINHKLLVIFKPSVFTICSDLVVSCGRVKKIGLTNIWQVFYLVFEETCYICPLAARDLLYIWTVPQIVHYMSYVILVVGYWLELSYFSFQPVFHKGHGMCYPVCGIVHIKEPLLLIKKSSPCGSSGFPL